MSDRSLNDADAQLARDQWFRYLDVIEPVRGDLHAYCQQLTARIWDAEDLVQDTLLKGFAIMARGDLHGPQSPVRNTKAYLFRVATNQWIDQQRKAQREILLATIEQEISAEQQDIVGALEKALQLNSPQEFAALILKEGYDFSLEEIADFVGTSIGSIKSALSRSRQKMQSTHPLPQVDDANQRLAKQFAETINQHDLQALKNLMAESMSIVVCNVGGGRGKGELWTEKSVRQVTAQYAQYQGEALVLLINKPTDASAPDVVVDVIRIDGSNDKVTRLTDYCFAPETLSHLAQALDLQIADIGYHQSPTTLVDMIATTTLPWRST